MLPSCPELPSRIKLPLDSMEVVDDVEDLLKDETNFKGLVSFHWLKLTDYNRDVEIMIIFNSHCLFLALTTIRLQLRQVSIKKVYSKIQHRKSSGLEW